MQTIKALNSYHRDQGRVKVTNAKAEVSVRHKGPGQSRIQNFSGNEVQKLPKK